MLHLAHILHQSLSLEAENALKQPVGKRHVIKNALSYRKEECTSRKTVAFWVHLQGEYGISVLKTGSSL